MAGARHAARARRRDQDSPLGVRTRREAEDPLRARGEDHLAAHPSNICTLHDVGDDYLVMELLDGESLADRLHRGPLPFSDVVRYGAEIAEALDKGHQSGIVHRDLKPGNVMLTKSGAKLLDFGLAKSSVIDVTPDADGATVQKPLTNQGTILGTFQYMAPEQLEGSEADARTDIFALGAVLYEMATGRRAFEGKNKTSLIAAIVSGDPRPMRELQPLTPAALEHVITKCLQKEPDRRWQNAADVGEELRWINEAGSQGGVVPPVVRKGRWPQSLTWIVLCGLVATVAALSWALWRQRPPDQPAIQASISMEPTAGLGPASGPPAFSPDGRTLVFAAEDQTGQSMLWLRPIDGSAPRPMASTDDASSPFWSPDGRYIGFFAFGKLKRIAAAGGESDVLAEADLYGGGTWNRGGTILFKSGIRSPLLRLVPGGQPVAVLDPKSIGADALLRPWFLPDGNHFLVFAGGVTQPKRQPDGVWIATLDGTEPPRFLTAAESLATWVEPGWLLFASGGVLRAQRFDPKTLVLSGTAHAIAPVQTYFARRSAAFAASSMGLLVYQKRGTNQSSELQLRNRSGDVIRTLGRGYFWSPSLSDDGRRVAVDLSNDSGEGDIWIIDVDGASRARLSFEAGNETSPIWSPDNRTVVYQGGDAATKSRREWGLITKRTGGVAEALVDLPGAIEVPSDWSRDGRFVAFHWSGNRADRDVHVISLPARAMTAVATTSADETAAVFSPDGRWIAYQSDESGRYEVYVQPFPPTGAKHQVSTSGGYWPRWRVADTIEYVDENRQFTAVRVETSNGLSIGSPQTFPLRVDDRGPLSVPNFDVAADGTILVNSIIRDNPAPLNLVVNWHRRLE